MVQKQSNFLEIEEEGKQKMISQFPHLTILYSDMHPCLSSPLVSLKLPLIGYFYLTLICLNLVSPLSIILKTLPFNLEFHHSLTQNRKRSYCYYFCVFQKSSFIWINRDPQATCEFSPKVLGSKDLFRLLILQVSI